MKKGHYTFIGSGILMIAAGTILYAFYGYKDHWLNTYGPIVLLIYGWLAILAMLGAFHPKPVKKGSNEKSGLRWLLHKVYFIVYLAWLWLVAQNVLQLVVLKNKRIDYVLSTQPVSNTTAVVSSIEDRWDKSGPTRFAIIAYQTTNGEIKQGIKDYYKNYSPGQKISIRYSLNHPDMFAITDSSYRQDDLP